MEIVLLFFLAWLLCVSYPWCSKLRGNDLFMQWVKNIPSGIVLILYTLAIPGLSTALLHRKSVKKYFDD